MSHERTEVEIEGRQLSLSNLDKVFYPATGFTKGMVLDYYTRIASVMLPHVKDRPLTLRRFPNGVDGQSFYEKHAPSHTPDWVRTAHVPSFGRSRDASASHSAPATVEYTVICDHPTLIWAANLAGIEMHVPLWRIGSGKQMPGPPDFLVFDLDPGPGTSIVECATLSGWIGERLRSGGLEPLAKTSGSKGLQLYARSPGDVGWERSRELAHEIAQAVERDHPELVTTNMRKDLRKGHVLIDWSQNQPSKTTVAAYSLRARPEPTVSTPVTWGEVEECASGRDPAKLIFAAPDVLRRVERLGDLFAPLVR